MLTQRRRSGIVSGGLFPRTLITSLLWISASSHLYATGHVAANTKESVHSGWLRLLHYRPDSTTPGGYHSEVLSQNFFLSASGSTDPLAELVRTLDEMAQPASEASDEHPQCRFPARKLWLQKHYPQHASAWPRISCKKYEAWRGDKDWQSVSLVLATGFLGNPASYFGHLLLKFNSSDKSQGNDLLDISINYGAIVPSNDGPFTYALKGIFGAYEGGFSQIGFYHHNHNYGEQENRDLWEYQLALSVAQVQFLMAHSWELLGQRFQYFFFYDNCAYQMAKLLQVADGVQFPLPEYPWLIPQTILQAIDQASIYGAPLLASVNYRPSRQSRFYGNYQRLESVLRRTLRDIAKKPELLNDEQFNALENASKSDILDTLIDYYQFRLGADSPSGDRLHQAYNAVLTTRFSLPPRAVRRFPRPHSEPHVARPPGFVQLGSIISDDGIGPSIGFRGAYYDALDAEGGHVSHSTLSLIDIDLDVIGDQFELRKLDIGKIESINVAATRLPGDGGKIWRLGLGLEEQSTRCGSNCLVFRTQAALGVSGTWIPRLLLGSLLGSSLQNDRNDEGYASIHAEIFSDIKAARNIDLRLRMRYSSSIDGQVNDPILVTAELRKRLNRKQDLRLEFTHQGPSTLRILWGRYW